MIGLHITKLITLIFPIDPVFAGLRGSSPYNTRCIERFSAKRHNLRIPLFHGNTCGVCFFIEIAHLLLCRRPCLFPQIDYPGRCTRLRDEISADTYYNKNDYHHTKRRTIYKLIC